MGLFLWISYKLSKIFLRSVIILFLLIVINLILSSYIFVWESAVFNPIINFLASEGSLSNRYSESPNIKCVVLRWDENFSWDLSDCHYKFYPICNDLDEVGKATSNPDNGKVF